MKLAKVFTYTLPDAPDGTVYRAAETEHGDYEVTWLSDGYSNLQKATYPADWVERFIIEAKWIVREIRPDLPEDAPLEVGDELVPQPVWPFPPALHPTNAVEGTWTEPEFLPPDDIEPVEDFGVALADIQKFVVEFPGFYVSIGKDGYGVHSEAHDDVHFVAKDHAELASVMQAVRVLEKHKA